MTKRPMKKRFATSAHAQPTNTQSTKLSPLAKPMPATGHEGTKVIPSKGRQPTPPKFPENRLRKISRKLRARAHWLLPNLIPEPYSDRAYRIARDKASNEETSVDKDEELRVRAIWGVELFGPNESDRLYEGLRQLGWSAGYGGSVGGALEWVQQQRSYGHGGYYNVGMVTRNVSPQRFLGVQNHASLPEDVDYLMVRLHQVVPAVTCVVVCFVLKESAATRYERELNFDRASRKQRHSRWSIMTFEPSHLKQKAVEVARSGFRGMASGWFKTNLPGYFAHANLVPRFPTAELLTTKCDDAFAEKKGKVRFDWRRLISSVAQRDVWTSSDIAGLKFVEHQKAWPRERENSWTVCVSLQSLPEDQVKMYGDDSRAVVDICHENLEGSIAYLAVSAFLAEVARDLKVSREQLNLSSTNGKTLRTIGRIQRFFDRNAGTPALVRELRDLAERPGVFEHYCGSFTAEPWAGGQSRRQHAKELREIVQLQASALIGDESSTREHFEQLSTILSIRESIGAQRRMEVLTIAALFVAAGSLVAAVPEWSVNVKTMFGSVYSAVYSVVERVVIIFGTW